MTRCRQPTANRHQLYEYEAEYECNLPGALHKDASRQSGDKHVAMDTEERNQLIRTMLDEGLTDRKSVV